MAETDIENNQWLGCYGRMLNHIYHNQWVGCYGRMSNDSYFSQTSIANLSLTISGWVVMVD